MAMDLLATGLAVAAAYALLRAAYNLLLHPLRRFPGPLGSRASVLPKVYHLLAGDLPSHVAAACARFGPVVRLAPGELAFADPRAWRDIYGRRPGRPELPQDPAHYNVSGRATVSIVSAGRELHDRLRKLLSPGFGDRALRAQAPVIEEYVGLLVARLRERAAAGPVDMRDWLDCCTFDIISSLAFGADFGCLRAGARHPWIRLTAGSLRNMARLHALRALGVLPAVRWLMGLLGVGDTALRTHMDMARAKTRQRLALGTGRDDLLDGLIASGMSFDELRENGSLLLFAGSETSATLLAGAVFLLATHADVRDRLAAEVRGQVAREADLTVAAVARLPYLTAVIREALRFYPPLAVTTPRRVPPGGADIAGRRVPEGTVVGVWHWAVYRDPGLFADPDRFDPDRFCRPGAKYADDRLDAINPFIIGPRNCIGQGLAYAEMRLILARLVWAFDLDLSDASAGWMDKQKNFTLWEKPPLPVQLSPARQPSATRADSSRLSELG